MPERTRVWPAAHWDWPCHLSHKHGIRCGEMIFVGGQVDNDAEGALLHPDDLSAQTAVVIGHIDTVLAGFGAASAC